jgi:hypothetical protein
MGQFRTCAPRVIFFLEPWWALMLVGGGLGAAVRAGRKKVAAVV